MKLVSFFPTFTDVMRAVVDHVRETGHQDIRVADDPQNRNTGYACQECPYYPTPIWYAPADTIHDVKGMYRDLHLTLTSDRMRIVELLIKEGLGARNVYRPTAWERLLKADSRG